ncbi:ABC-three component system middle component 6 [Lysinibacillus agricola]|uniref:ABC-three component system middle component 6 n=1 Tax=Lysinibacillus agricola TaxID=2590012 RepID=UPI003C1873B4
MVPELEPLSIVLEKFFFHYVNQNEIIGFGSEVITMNSKFINYREKSSNYFLFSKHTTVEENILYSAKALYDLLSDKPKHIDELLMEYSQKNDLIININIERIIYLSLTFLYSIGVIKLEGNTIIKQKDDGNHEF